MSRFVTTWGELERAMPRGWRARQPVRAVALRGARLAREPLDDGIWIVHYHYVFEDQLDGFERQLDLLQRSFEVVSLDEAVRRLGAGESTGRTLAVTFDDGFRNQLQAARSLAAREIRACFYLIGDLVGAEPDEAERICLDRIEMPRAAEPLSWDEAAELVSLGHDVGSHTQTHPNLVLLAPGELDNELRASRERLESRLCAPVHHFSAPFGTRERFSVAVSKAARRVGYASCASAQRGVNDSPADVYALRRHHLLAQWPAGDVRALLRIP